MRRRATLSSSFVASFKYKKVEDCFLSKSFYLSFGSTIICWIPHKMSWKLPRGLRPNLLVASFTSLKRTHIQRICLCKSKKKIRFLSDQSDSCQLSKIITCDQRSLILIQVPRLKIKLCNKNQLFFHFSIWISIGVSGFWAMGVWVGFPTKCT